MAEVNEVYWSVMMIIVHSTGQLFPLLWEKVSAPRFLPVTPG